MLLCPLQPFPGPEILHDFYSCSVEIDWLRYVTNDCKEKTLGYEVQYINGCTNSTLKHSYVNLDEDFRLPDKIPGECFENNYCYVRIRTRFRSDPSSWSDYSAWTTLSNNFQAEKGINNNSNTDNSSYYSVGSTNTQY